MIRKATNNDIKALADIHLATLPNDLLPRIGARFLSKQFYPAILRSNHAFTIVDIEDDEVRSFIIFAYDSVAVTEQVMGNKVVLSWYLSLALLRDFSLLGEIFGYLKGFKTELHVQIDGKLEEIPELYLLATAPEHHSKGIGGRLINRGLDMLSKKEEGLQCIVKTSSDRARKFYTKHHFKEIGLEYRQRRKLYLLLYSPHDRE